MERFHRLLPIDLAPTTMLNDFMQQGGPVLWWLAGLVVLFWSLALERAWYFYRVFPLQQQGWVKRWQQRSDRHSWFAQVQRTRWLDEAEANVKQHLALLKLMVSLFPMLGLLGTVTGMITVFDVIALEGSPSSNSMAEGIAQATLPTMAGMVAALVGMFVYSRLSRLSERRLLHLSRLMSSKMSPDTIAELQRATA